MKGVAVSLSAVLLVGITLTVGFLYMTWFKDYLRDTSSRISLDEITAHCQDALWCV